MESSSQSSAYLMHSGKNSMDQTPCETLPIQPDRINKVCMPSQKSLHSIRTSSCRPQIYTFWVWGLHMARHLSPPSLAVSYSAEESLARKLGYAQILCQRLASLMGANAGTHVKEFLAQQVFKGRAGQLLLLTQERLAHCSCWG